jgi:hypothetical protein
VADFPTLKASISIKQTADMLGLKVRPDGADFRGACPICREGDDRAFKLFTQTNTFYCWRHKKAGTIIDLVMGVLNCDEPAAGCKLADAFSIKSPRKTEGSNGKFDPEKWGRDLNPDAPELAPLGISADTYRAFGAGYNATKPSLKGMLCIPVRDAGGIPLGFVGVNLESRELTFPKGLSPDMLLNCDRTAPGKLYAVAHPLDVLRQIETGIDELANVVAIMTTITPDILDRLAALTRERGVEAIEFQA